MKDIRPLLIRIFYSTSFTVVFLLVLAFIVLTPADAVYQALRQAREWDIGVIVGTYVLTALLAALIYASRLYTNRSILQGIPKTYVPIEREDLPGKCARKEIVEGLERSAIISYTARPRFDGAENDSPTASARISATTKSEMKKGEEPTWGKITHPGWSPPSSPDLPNLQYDIVIAELPDLIEAKAVSLAPTEHQPIAQQYEIPLPDERIVEILQRPLNMGLRDYLAYLDSLALIKPSSLGSEFLTLYERARFSTKPLHEPQFRSLMGVFASILRGMTTLNPDLLGELQDFNQNNATDWQKPSAWSPKTASTFSVNDGANIRHHHQQPPRRVSEDSVPSLPTEDEDDENDSDDDGDQDQDDQDHDAFSLRTAPLHQPHPNLDLSNPQSQSQSQPQINPTLRRPTSPASSTLRNPLGQTRSAVSIASRTSNRSGGSVIRLTEARTTLDLPYVIEIPAVPRGRL